MPTHSPTAGGTKDQTPIPADCSSDGISRLQTEAAVITPAAKPVIARRSESLNSLRIKNTQAAPSAVPKNGMRIPLQITAVICFSLSPFIRPKSPR